MSRISLVEAYDNRSVIKQIADLFRFKQERLTSRNAGPNISISGEGEDVVISAVTEPTGTVEWGGVVGTLSNQTDLADALDAKQPVGDYVTGTTFVEGLATKQDVGDYATTAQLEQGLSAKQDYSVNIRNIHIGLSETPSDSLGENGDLYIYRP